MCWKLSSQRNSVEGWDNEEVMRALPHEQINVIFTRGLVIMGVGPLLPTPLPLQSRVNVCLLLCSLASHHGIM
jgi:hypothetical protein